MYNYYTQTIACSRLDDEFTKQQCQAATAVFKLSTATSSSTSTRNSSFNKQTI